MIRKLALARPGASYEAALVFEDGRDAIRDYLHPAELAILAGARSEKRRRDYSLGRLAAKRALAELGVKETASALEIRSGVFQEPLVVGASGRPMGVSISHSGSVSCAVAFPSEHPVALDLERLDHDRFEALRSQVTYEEAELFRHESESELACFARGWTVKEALSKAIRCGLTAPFEVLALAESCERAGDAVTGRFRNFYQYRYFSWSTKSFAFSLVVPHRTHVDPNWPEIATFLESAAS